MTVAYSYVRFSTSEQAAGDSLERQRSAAASYAAQRGYVLDTSYTDPGVSAHRGKHVAIGAFGRFVRAVEDAEISRGSVLLIEAFDRFSRQEALDAMELLSRLLRHGSEIVTLEDGQIYSRATMREGTQLIVAAIKMQSSFDFSQRLGRRVRSAWSRKRGEAATRKLTKWCPAWLELLPDRSAYVEKDGRFATVRLIFQLYVNGLGYDGIARELNARNIPTFENLGRRPTAAGWQTGYVNRILQNRAAIGEYQPCVRPVGEDGLRRSEPVGEPVAGYFPAAIDRALWDRAAAARKRRGDGKGGAGGTGGPKRAIVCANLFTGLMRCAHCRGPMFLNSKSYRWRLPHDRTARSGVPSFQAGHYLRCSNAMRRVPDPATGRAKCAVGGFVRYARFERLVLDGLEAVLLDGDKAVPASPAAAAARGLEESLSSLRDGLARKRAALDDAILTAAGKPERMAAVERIEARLDEDKREITRLERALEATRADVAPRASLAVVRALRTEAVAPNAGQRLVARLQIAEALKPLVDAIWIDGASGFALVEYAGWPLRFAVDVPGGRIAHEPHVKLDFPADFLNRPGREARMAEMRTVPTFLTAFLMRGPDDAARGWFGAGDDRAAAAE